MLRVPRVLEGRARAAAAAGAADTARAIGAEQVQAIGAGYRGCRRPERAIGAGRARDVGAANALAIRGAYQLCGL